MKTRTTISRVANEVVLLRKVCLLGRSPSLDRHYFRTRIGKCYQTRQTTNAFSTTTSMRKSEITKIGGNENNMDSDETSTQRVVEEGSFLIPLNPLPSMERTLSWKVIQKRVAERVSQRNAWPEFHYPSPVEFMKHGWESFGILNNFVGSTSCPSTNVLDQELPVLSIDWKQIQDFGRREKEESATTNQREILSTKGTEEEENLSTIQLTWIGHATILAQLRRRYDDAGGNNNKRHASWNILTDPIFSTHCSPFPNWSGPKRFRRPAIDSPSDFKNIGNTNVDIVLISHNHYDHLDYPSIRNLAHDYPHCTFVVPLGLKSWFDNHIPQANGRVIELDWHEQVTLHRRDDDQSLCFTTTDKCSPSSSSSSLQITSVPMCHWSSRKGFDRDKTLWCGYIAEEITTATTTTNPSQKQQSSDNGNKFLFAGDTGYFEACSTEIHDVYGPIHVAALPIGAYHPNHLFQPSHMNPTEALKMFQRLQIQYSVPIHWGTFPLTIENALEPRELLQNALGAAKIDPKRFPIWNIGQTVSF